MLSNHQISMPVILFLAHFSPQARMGFIIGIYYLEIAKFSHIIVALNQWYVEKYQLQRTSPLAYKGFNVGYG